MSNGTKKAVTPATCLSVRDLLKRLIGKPKYVTHPIGVKTTQERKNEIQEMNIMRKKAIPTHRWTKEEEDVFLCMIEERQESGLNDRDWQHYLVKFPARSPDAIRRKYMSLVLNLTYNHGVWSEQEIVNLAHGVLRYGNCCHLIRMAMANTRSTKNIRQKWQQLCQKLHKNNVISDMSQAADVILNALCDVPCTLIGITNKEREKISIKDNN